MFTRRFSRGLSTSSLCLGGATALCMLAGEAWAQRPLNTGFERVSTQGTGLPWGWTPMYQAGSAAIDSAHAHDGRYSVRVQRTAQSAAESDEWGALRLFVPPYGLYRRQVQVTFWVRGAVEARPRVSVESWAIGRVLTGDSATIRLTDSTVWVRHSLQVRVDTAAFAAVITLGSTGPGTVWYDDIQVELDGKRTNVVLVSAAPAPLDVRWLRAHSTALTTVRPDDPAADAAADLRAIDAIIGSARVIALGEDTHGTSEFFSLKHRVMRHLVEQRGLRIFAIEANQLAVEQINRYVQGASGTAQQVMRAMFQVWNTDEMEMFVEWMRTWNSQHRNDMVSFVGYDMQDPTLPIDSIQAFLGKRAPELLAPVQALQHHYREAWRRGSYPRGEDSTRAQWRNNADSVWQLLTARKPAWLAQASSHDDSMRVEWAVQNANVVRQAANRAFTLELSDRDSAMAENVRWIVEHAPAGAKVVVWAHNAHVGRGADVVTGFFGGKSMGAYLSRMYGDEYRVFGLVSYDGQYRGTLSGEDRRLVNGDAVPAPVGTVEEVLHRVATSSRAVGLVTDLRDARQLPKSAWLRQPHPTRLTGYAIVDFDWETMVDVPAAFDALLFVDHTKASRTIERR